VPFGRPGPLEELVVQGERGPKILLLDVEGVLSESPEERRFAADRESTVARVVSQLELARDDDDVRAILLRIDSPGGTVTASDVLHHEIRRFAQEREIPVLAQLMGLAASGGYYVAMAADAVYAHPTTITGSIGVIFTGVTFAGLLEKLGVENQTVKSGDRKDTGSPLRRMTPAERAQMQSVIDDLHARFREVVVAGRARAGLTPERVREVADGRVYTASQARELGLVDGIAYLQDTIDEAKRRLGVTEARIILYRHDDEVEDPNIYSRALLGHAHERARPSLATGAGSGVPDEIRVRLQLGPESPVRGPAFLYLWPGADALP
jgi:protease-4